MILEGVNNLLIGCESTVSSIRYLLKKRERNINENHDKSSDQEKSNNILRKNPNLNICDFNRRICIFTTASLPWMTGTSVNPLLRAAYLSRGRPKYNITLALPWIQMEDQIKLFPSHSLFENQETQKKYVKQWLCSAELKKESEDINIVFYDGVYHEAFGSIFPVTDLTSLVNDSEADICILEEPEHLNWFKPEGAIWTNKFNYVIGIIHTNYIFYASQEIGGIIKKEVVRMVSAWMARAHCHRVIKLSGALQTYASEKEVVCNVHGVRSEFLEIGSSNKFDSLRKKSIFSKEIYFIGKTLWTKGFDKLLPLLRSFRRRNNQNLEIDAYGDGPDKKAVMKKTSHYKLNINYFNGIDHKALKQYKIFLNPSKSEVLCTTIAEALAMGKFVICARHSSNEFFYQFPNCLPFSTSKEFSARITEAKINEPTPLSQELYETLSWSAATERFISVCSLPLNIIQNEKETSQSNNDIEIQQESAQKSLEQLDFFLASLQESAFKGKHGKIIKKLIGAPKNRMPKEKLDEYIMVNEIEIPSSETKIKNKMKISNSEKALVELLRNGVQQGAIENVLDPLLNGYDKIMNREIENKDKDGNVENYIENISWSSSSWKSADETEN